LKMGAIRHYFHSCPVTKFVLICPHGKIQCLTLRYVLMRTIKKWQLCFPEQRLRKAGRECRHRSSVGHLLCVFMFMLSVNEMLAALPPDARIVDSVHNAVYGQNAATSHCEASTMGHCVVKCVGISDL
jgi:hypothetical protein